MIITIDGDTPREHFTIIPNAIMRDGSLSLKAKGLLAYLLGHERGYSLSVEQLTRENADGDYAIRGAVFELEAAGMLSRSQSRDALGRMSDATYVVTLSGLSASGFPANGEPQYIRIQREEDHECVLDLETSLKDMEADSTFDTFWAAYPLKVGKRAAEKAWKAARGREKPGAILAGLTRAVEAWGGQEERYIPHPSTWLNQDRWADESHPKRGGQHHASIDEVLRLIDEREAADAR